MIEARGCSGEQTVKPNVGDLIVERLGIGFENPPREIPLTFANRIRHPILYSRFSRHLQGRYFPGENAFLYRENQAPKIDLYIRSHEAAHSLFHGVNPDWHRAIRDTLPRTSSFNFTDISLGVSRRDRDERSIRRLNSQRVPYTVGEGIADWVAIEVGVPDHDSPEQIHLNYIELMVDHLFSVKTESVTDKQKLRFYVDGHRFVNGVVGYLVQKGMSKGEALTRLMLCPPMFPEEVDIGGAQYAQQNLI